METKLDKLRKFMRGGDWHNALRLAAGWPRLGEHKEAIQKGWAAKSSPVFYKAIKENPDELIAAGIAALKERYGNEDA